MREPPIVAWRRVTPVGLRPPYATPRHRQSVRINRQGIYLSEPKRCSEKPSHLYRRVVAMQSCAFQHSLSGTG